MVIGLAWGVWRLPLFWMAGDFHAEITFGLSILQYIALSIVITWLFNGTGGSLLLVVAAVVIAASGSWRQRSEVMQ